MRPYADEWNDTYRQGLSSNPQQIDISGSYDEMEVIEMMDCDELEMDVASAISEMREAVRINPRAVQLGEGAVWDETIAMDIEVNREV